MNWENVFTLLGAAIAAVYVTVRAVAIEFMVWAGAYLLYQIVTSGPFG